MNPDEVVTDLAEDEIPEVPSNGRSTLSKVLRIGFFFATFGLHVLLALALVSREAADSPAATTPELLGNFMGTVLVVPLLVALVMCILPKCRNFWSLLKGVSIALLILMLANVGSLGK